MNNVLNKIIIVTGGSGLLGTEIVNHLKLNGAIVFNFDITVNTDLDNRTCYCDVTNQESIENALKFVLLNFQKIDALVNNAYPRTSDWSNKFEDVNFSSWQKNIDLQLNSVFLVSQLILKVMSDQKFGSIINISSIYGLVGPDFSIYEGTNMTMPVAYSAIKGGIINFTRYLASYFGPQNIRINCISPGGIFDNHSNAFVENYNKKVPLRRMALPNDISPAVEFLISDSSSYITGQNLIIDGGWTAI